MAKVVIITQARLQSSRLPEKILKNINGKSLLEIHLARLKKSKYGENLLVATTKEKDINKVIQIANKKGVMCFQGSMEDVLDRFYKAALTSKPDYVVRVTSDCPLLDSKLLDKVIEEALNQDLDYTSNTLLETYPDGQDVEVIKWLALKSAWQNAQSRHEREHVTPYIINNSTFKGKNNFTSLNFTHHQNFNHIRMTVDEAADFEAIKILIENLGDNMDWLSYTKFIEQNLTQFANQKIIRNEGSKM